MQGVITALITPFDLKGQINEAGFRENIRFQLANHIDGILLFGSTGEGSTLNEHEKVRLLQIAKEETAGKCHLMAATGTNSTDSTIRLTLLAEELGVDSCLVVTPYYNKPTQEGLFLHYQAISSAVKTPLYIYHIPGRTACKITPQTLWKIASLPNIKGIKESTGDFAATIEMMERVNFGFTLLSGDDGLTLPLMALGARGVISVASNVIPADMKSLVESCLKEDYPAAREIHYRLSPFLRALFLETNPIPLKAYMNERKMPAGPCRLPLTALSEENKTLIQKITLPQAIHG